MSETKTSLVVDFHDRSYSELLVLHYVIHPVLRPLVEHMAIHQPWSAGELLAEIEQDEVELVWRRTHKDRRPLFRRRKGWKDRQRQVPR